MRIHQSYPSATATATCPVIDAVEARWAAEAVASLAHQLDADSVVAMVLQQSHRELMSLAASESDAQVIGPLRVHVAA